MTPPASWPDQRPNPGLVWGVTKSVCDRQLVCDDAGFADFRREGKTLCALVRHTDAPSGLPRVLSWLGRLSCRNTGSQLNGRHPRPVNAYHATRNIDDNDMRIDGND